MRIPGPEDFERINRARVRAQEPWNFGNPRERQALYL
jgi:hypothetical protein